MRNIIISSTHLDPNTKKIQSDAVTLKDLTNEVTQLKNMSGMITSVKYQNSEGVSQIATIYNNDLNYELPEGNFTLLHMPGKIDSGITLSEAKEHFANALQAIETNLLNNASVPAETITEVFQQAKDNLDDATNFRQVGKIADEIAIEGDDSNGCNTPDCQEASNLLNTMIQRHKRN